MDTPLQLKTVAYKAGAYVVVEGTQNADSFYIIQQGKVGITMEVEVAEEDNKVLGPGDFFAVISTMSVHNHIETAKALTDVVLIMVHKDQYGALIQVKNQVAMKIIMQFSKRLRHLNETLAGITMKQTADAGTDHLYEAAEYYYKQKQFTKAIHIYNRYLKYSPDGEYAQTAYERVAKATTYMTGGVVKKEASFNPSDLKRTYQKDAILFIEGEPGDELFIIQSGSIKITKISSDNEVLLAVLKTGDIFGEMALLEGKPRAASAMAYDDCDVMVVNRSNFNHMISTQPQLIARVTALLADRIWLIFKQLANTQIKDPVGRLFDSLQIQLEKNRISLTDNKPYTFSFGKWELANMVGLTDRIANQALITMLGDEKIVKVINEKIYAFSVPDVVKQAEYYRKMDKIKKAQLKAQQERA